MRLTLLHTNDVHGEIEALARVATLVERIRAETPHPVVFVDCGDVEETTQRISNLTKGVAMHRLLSAAGCEAAAVGNAAWLRYGTQVLADQARAASYPLLLANLHPVEGVHETALLGGVGFVGVTASFADYYREEAWVFGVEALDEVETVRRCAADLRARGAGFVVCLSHLGLDVPDARIDDRRLAPAVAGHVDLILGAHTHDLLPEGEWIDGVLVAQAGSHGTHLGRVDVEDGDPRASVLPVPADLPPHPPVLAEAARIEPELDAHLDEVVGELDRPLDGVWVAEMLRQRMDAEVGIVTEAVVLNGTLPPGPVSRRELYELSDSGANAGVSTISGERLRRMIEIGTDPAFAATTRGPLRGRPRGPLHVAGIDPAAIDPDRDYVVAATDWELERYGGLVDPEWRLPHRSDFPTIVREAIEEALAADRLERPVVQRDPVAPEGAAGGEQPLP